VGSAFAAAFAALAVPPVEALGDLALEAAFDRAVKVRAPISSGQ
jgi:hypothetical protein